MNAKSKKAVEELRGVNVLRLLKTMSLKDVAKQYELSSDTVSRVCTEQINSNIFRANFDDKYTGEWMGSKERKSYKEYLKQKS